MFEKLRISNFFFLILAFVMMSFYATKFAYHDRLPRTEMYTCKVIRILCFGDSLTTGVVNVKTLESYPYSIKLQEYFDSHNSTALGVSKRPIFQVQNAGMPGARAKGQMLPHLAQILQRSRIKYSWVIILAGTNDLNSVLAPGKGNLSYNSMSIFNAIIKLHNVTHMLGARSLAVSIPDRQCEGLGTCTKLKDTHKKINQLLRGFVAKSKNKMLLADLCKHVYLPRDRKLWSDPFHFTKQGYEKVADIIYNAMRGHI
ncbi:uncharacterized protein LOC111322064 [Stylophora pistillata]|uniref:uncharacterized protein LOC111322064 n=1 Tax=Stylophora pistillata TaxID=50429 RepID=UPI000C038B49|nr:uncharacterized protein LOC111322064 [Stylophora pistillata]